MLKVIGHDLINPHQIATIQQFDRAGESKNPKRIIISMSNGDNLLYVAGEDGYAAACKLRDEMLDGLYVA